MTALACLVEGMPASEYHAADGLSASTCKKMATVTPAEVKWQRDNPKPSTDRLVLGTYTHAMLLEPETLEESFLVVEKFPRRSADEKARWAAIQAQAEAEGKVIVWDEKDAQGLDTARRMRDAIHAHPEARELLSAGRGEVSMFATDPETGIKIRSREDWFPDCQNLVVDLKTARNPGEGFAKDAYNLGYHVGQHHYRLVRQQYNRAMGMDEWDTWPDYQWLVVGVEAPHLVAIYRPSDEMAEVGAIASRRGRDAYVKCIESGEWPGLPSGIINIDPPRWAKELTHG